MWLKKYLGRRALSSVSATNTDATAHALNTLPHLALMSQSRALHGFSFAAVEITFRLLVASHFFFFFFLV